MRIPLVHLRFGELVEDREKDTIEDGGQGGEVAREELGGEKESTEVGDGTLTNIGTAVDALLADHKQRWEPERGPG